MTFGSYPEIGVKQARELLENAKTALKNGVKPMAQKKAINITTESNLS
ncbi:MAG: Arm DNA-binding domain-containing protein [Deltaproteobacteria bacterium]|nr:Arm DNA-binding domain-containing protein [Deltaproteobacteria bacterium]